MRKNKQSGQILETFMLLVFIMLIMCCCLFTMFMAVAGQPNASLIMRIFV